MNNVELLITKILEQKVKDDVEEVKLDLKRVVVLNFGCDEADLGYIKYLFKHYQNEINCINFSIRKSPNNFRQYQISPIEDIRNYLIKIAIIRICKEKDTNVIIEQMNNLDYCIDLLD
jgi:hypothetical protein